jgi:hypothetical protein
MRLVLITAFVFVAMMLAYSYSTAGVNGLLTSALVVAFVALFLAFIRWVFHY